MTRGADAATAPGARFGAARFGLRSPLGRAATLVAGGTIALFTSQAVAQYEPGGGSLPFSLPGVPGAPGGPTGTAATVTNREQPEPRRSEFRPTIAVDATFTTNANFDRARNEKESDFVTQIAPGFQVAEYGAHSSLTGYAFVPFLIYARTGGENNRAIPEVSLTGLVDALDRRFVLDSGIDLHRQFLTPLGARPISAVTNTLNEYSSGVYHVTPIFRSYIPGTTWHYEVRDANTWTNLQGEPGALNDAYTNEAAAFLSRDPTPFGGSIEYSFSRVLFKDTVSPPLTTKLARLRGDYAPDPQLRLSASLGHENNSYPFATYSDAIYGVGARWRPSERTAVDATWEHRFFGSSWLVAFDHRTPLTVWSLRSSRDVSTYPQQLATFAAGSDVNSLLNSLFSSRIPDPVARQQAIDNLIRTYGLPSNLTVPVQLYSQQARLVTDTRAVAGFLGVRNNVYFTLFRNRNQQVVQAGESAGVLLPFNDVIQSGANVVWSSRLSSIATLTGILDYLHSTGQTETQTGRTNNASASLTISTPISPLTDFHYGLRYQSTRSSESISINGEEFAVFAGIVHRFR